MPICPVSSADFTTSIWVTAPKTSTANINLPNYGLSFLFIKSGPTASTYGLRGVITATI